MEPGLILRRVFEAAIRAAQPQSAISLFLPPPPKGRTIVVGAGKASAAMARALEVNWSGEIDDGLVVTRYGHGVPCRTIRIVEAGHPVPDDEGQRAAEQLLTLVTGLTPDDLVICLISGGGSALLPLPCPGITLADKQDVAKQLLKSGATISEINCVRRHLSAIKGGRLAAACFPARVITLAISDVPGDNPVDIASGPTVPDTTTCADALAVLRRHRVDLPAHVSKVLLSGTGESVKPGDPRLETATFHFIATPQAALEAAAREAASLGIRAHILSDRMEGESRELGKALGAIALQVSRHHQPLPPPCLLLSGGEATVTVRGTGRGGPNVEFLLALGITLDGAPGIYALAGDTDGIDGEEEIAGAVLTPDSLQRAWERGMNPVACLDDNDAHSFFRVLGDSVITGPTLTNVNDFRAILVTAAATAE